MGAINVLNTASFFVKKGVSPLQLQKLLYYAQVWFFVKHGNRLFFSDIKAWKYGPVVPEIWQLFRFIRRTDGIPRNKLDDYNPPSAFTSHLQEVWDAYGHLSGSQLVDLTHSELPWKLSRIGLLSDQPSSKPVIISKRTTREFILDHGKIPFIPATSSRGEYSNQHL